MTLQDRLEKNKIFFILLIYYLGGYFLIDFLTTKRHDLHHLPLPFESRVPFLPASVFVYMLVYFFLALGYLAVDDLAYFRKVIRAFYLCVTIHFIIFLIYPVEYNLRPVVEMSEGWVQSVIVFYYWLDLPYNSFPSMHVSNAFLVSFFIHRYRPGWGWVLFPLAILLSAAVVLVKQHYIMDVLSGFLVGWFCFRVVFGKKGAISSQTTG